MSFINLSLSAYSSATIKSTTEYSTSYTLLGAMLATVYTGGDVGCTWVSTNSALPQKLNFDFGRSIKLRGLTVYNYHSSGGFTQYGLNNIRIYGTDSTTAFNNLTGTDLTDLSLITEITVQEHVAADVDDPQYFFFNNDTYYQYIIIVVVDRLSVVTRIALRSIKFWIDTDDLVFKKSYEKSFLHIDRAIPYYDTGPSIKSITPVLKRTWDRGIKKTITSSVTSSASVINPPTTKVVSSSELKKHMVAYWSYAIKVPRWNPPSFDPFIDTTGVISGVVKVEGVLTEGVLVRLTFKESGILIRQCYTDDKGRFLFDDLEFDKDFYTVTAHFEGYNAVVKDSVKPVRIKK